MSATTTCSPSSTTTSSGASFPTTKTSSPPPGRELLVALVARLQPSQVALPDTPQQRPSDELAERAAHPPGEAQPLIPAEPRSPSSRASQGEATSAAHRAFVRDADGPARPPLGNDQHVGRGEWSDSCPAFELRSHAGAATAPEPDRFGVPHPFDVTVDVLDVGPDRGGRGLHRDGRPDKHRHRPPATSRSCGAASSGGTVFTRMPVPCSKPATTVVRVWTSMYQWNDSGPAFGGAVCTTRLYGTSPRADASWARASCAT